MLVLALVISILNYCLRVWGITNITQMERAQKLQYFAAKVAMGGARKHDRVSPIFEKLNWLRMEESVFMDACIMVFKCQRGLIPDWLFTFPTRTQRTGNRNRQANDLEVKRFATDWQKLFSDKRSTVLEQISSLY